MHAYDMRTLAPRALLLLALLAAAAGCGDEQPAVRSALLITLDTTRADALGCLGGLEQGTPSLDALAAEGVLYTQARTVAPVTLPAHSSMLTGLFPPRHTVRTNSRLALPQEAVTVAERARERGFQTSAFVAASVLSASFGLDQGFERYDEPPVPDVPDPLHFASRPATEVADAACAWIEALDPERPFLAWVHFFDPHQPYAAPERFVQQAGGDAYRGEVAYMDHEVGRVLAALARRGLDGETLVIVVGDHGESLGEHGEATHTTLAYSATIRVPLIVRYPDRYRQGERSDEIVSVADVGPTLVEALGLGAPGDIDGQSLYRRSVPGERGVYFESYYGFLSFGWSPIVGWADKRGNYLYSSRPEFYDPGADPREQRDLIDQVPAAELLRYRAGIEAVAARPPLHRAEDDDAGAGAVDALNALGYTGSPGEDAPPPPLSPTDKKSPRDMQPIHALYLQGKALNAEQRWRESAPILRKVVAANPENASAWFHLASALLPLGEYEEALAASREAITLRPDWAGPLHSAAKALRSLGRREEALALLEPALGGERDEPGSLGLLAEAADICAELGRDQDADRYRIRLIKAQEEAAQHAVDDEH